MDIYLHNTLSGRKEKFEPIHTGTVSMYHCGPTVYGPQHIGNLSMFIFTDVLRRTIEHAGYDVKQVINFTDVGHLSGDNEGNADEGEDRMTKGLKRDGLDISIENMRLLGKKYAEIFLADLSKLNIKTDGTQFPYASDFIEEQIAMVKILEEKGFTYSGLHGIYFDTNKFPDYGKLGNINLAGIHEGARVGQSTDKRSPTDFLLWKSDPNLGWDSPWGKGFPGWHLECSAMIFKILGEQIDIHTGGIEHVAIHHNNEIAQSESASGKKPFSRFWLHREHIRIGDEKVAKSTGNVLYLSDLIEKDIHPLSYRYWVLTSRYNTPSNFTWEAVEGAQVALEKIVTEYISLEGHLQGDLIKQFEEAISNNLNTPVAVSLLQEARSREDVDKMDEILGLNIKKLSEQIQEIPNEIKDLVKERDEARKKEDWALSDQIRDKIEYQGFRLKDLPEKTLILRSLSSLT